MPVVPLNRGRNQGPVDPAAARRQQLIVWLAFVVSVGLYFVLAKLSTPAEAHENPLLIKILLVLAVGCVAVSFPLKTRLAGPPPGTNGVLVALALCEAAALFGIVAWFLTAWPYFYVFLLLGLVGHVLHYPGRRDSI